MLKHWTWTQFVLKIKHVEKAQNIFLRFSAFFFVVEKNFIKNKISRYIFVSDHFKKELFVFFIQREKKGTVR